MAEHDIVFEDLRGNPETESATVDLDSDDKEKGIERHSQRAGDERVVIDVDRSDYDSDEGDVSFEHGQDDSGNRGEDDEYSKKVRARIEREARAKRKATKERDFWQQRAQAAERQAAEARKTSLEKSVEHLDSSIESVEGRLENAFEEGDSKLQAQLTSKLSDLKADKKAAQYELEHGDFTYGGDSAPDDGKIAPAPDNPQAELVKDWKDKNDDWYGATGFERYTRTANRIDKELYAEGYDPGAQEYYEELDRRIREKHPSLFDDDTVDDDKADSSPPRSPVAPVGGAESASSQQRSSSSRVELDEADFANIRRFNLDPNDPEVLKEYARNKREAERGAL